jgi:TolA-binding protein
MKKIYLLLMILLLLVGLVACKTEIPRQASTTKNSVADNVKLSAFNKLLKEADDLAKDGKLGTAFGKVNRLTVEYNEEPFKEKIKEKLNEYQKLMDDIDSKVDEERFNKALSLFEKGHFIEAKDWFKRSAAKASDRITKQIEECDRFIKEKGDSSFNEGKDAYTKKDYRNAYQLLKNIKYTKNDKNYTETMKILEDLEIKVANLYLDDIEKLYYQGKSIVAYDILNQIRYEFNIYDDKVTSDRMYKLSSVLEDKVSEIKRTEELKNAPEPKVGMTMDEVLKSSWGYPLDKNKTITAKITYEQWVYSNYRYIYIENGKVTAIQTH